MCHSTHVEARGHFVGGVISLLLSQEFQGLNRQTDRLCHLYPLAILLAQV